MRAAPAAARPAALRVRAFAGKPHLLRPAAARDELREAVLAALPAAQESGFIGVYHDRSSASWVWQLSAEGELHKGTAATADDAARARDACLRRLGLAGLNDEHCAFLRGAGGKEIRNTHQTSRCQGAVTAAGVKARLWRSPSDVACADCGDTDAEHCYVVVRDDEGGETREARCDSGWCVSSHPVGAARARRLQRHADSRARSRQWWNRKKTPWTAEAAAEGRAANYASLVANNKKPLRPLDAPDSDSEEEEEEGAPLTEGGLPLRTVERMQQARGADERTRACPSQRARG